MDQWLLQLKIHQKDEHGNGKNGRQNLTKAVIYFYSSIYHNHPHSTWPECDITVNLSTCRLMWIFRHTCQSHELDPFIQFHPIPHQTPPSPERHTPSKRICRATYLHLQEECKFHSLQVAIKILPQGPVSKSDPSLVDGSASVEVSTHQTMEVAACRTPKGSGTRW